MGDLPITIKDARDAGADQPTTLDDRLAGQLQGSLAEFGRSIVGRGAVEAERGDLYVNPWSFAQPAAGIGIAPFDVPAMGFAWLRPDVETGPVPSERRGWFGRRKRQEPPLAEENVLRNEFFEVRFDPHTGAIRSISDYHSRDPRLAQQIALRLPRGGAPGGEVNYSIMAADELVVTSAGPVLGEIVARGRLMDREGRRVAGFRQTTRARRGSRMIELQIELEIDRQPGANPWDSYYAARFAWKDEAARSAPQREHGQPADGADAVRIATLSRHPPRQAADDVALRWAAVPSALRTAEARHAAGRARRDGPVVPAGHRHRRAASDGRGARVHRAAAEAAGSAPAADAHRLVVPSRLPQRAGHALGAGAGRRQRCVA